MDLRQIKYFIAVAEEKNIGRAALKLCISQPPLTRQIQQVERDLDVQLFNRLPKGVELTDAGVIFLEECRNIQSLVERATELTKQAGAGNLGRLDIAIFGTAILNIIPKILLAFKQSYPNVNVVLHTMDKDKQINALRERRISLGFNRLLSPLPDITSKLITKESMLMAVNEDSPLSKLDIIPIQAIELNPLVLFPTGPRPNFVDRITKLCQEVDVTPNVSQIVSDVVTGVSLVASGFGVCLIPESATVLSLPRVVYRPISGLPDNSKIDLSCIFLKDNNSPILANFLKTIDQCKIQFNKE